ncbi:Tetratricopeptide repeat protein 27 [Strongyloides ratti]|uniref:Tetratricopeptide repeat protein 27 n=1 Tax=Strongyloides ratti TaxID=34506 RepID=A0A090LBG6_STRRB|nr:Tetratricopeptide repeat protein 27 [Strongyloides ratti]CEF67111.1 Tetratricopeptide repeat protein 27 [Strongyloides ratti]
MNLKTYEGSQDDILYLAKFFLEGYIALNYVGYTNFIKNFQTEVPEFSFIFSDKSLSIVENAFSFGLNKPYQNCRGLQLLYLSKIIYDSIKESKQDIYTLFNKYQLLLLWASLLNEPEISLKDIGEDLFDDIQGVLSKSCSGSLETMDEKLKGDIIAFYLTSFYFNLIFYNYDEAEKILKRAMELGCFNVEFVGVLGKRTKFQEKDIAQLVTNCTLNDKKFNDDDYSVINKLDLPVNVLLNDDTLLETVCRAEKHEEEILSPLQSSILLAFAYFERKSQFKDELLAEKLTALYNKVLSSSNKSWAVTCTSLIERSVLEKNNRRKVERSCSQIEVIAKLLDGIDDKTSDDDKYFRIKLAIPSGMLPFWKVKMYHAEILVTLGCISEALMIYESLSAWDYVIDCYKMLKQVEKAETLVRNLLSKQENPLYYCYLGDITLQSSYYEKAISISGDKSARARKSLGELLINRNDYENAYKNLKRSVELQPIQLGVWFNLGHCSWKIENYQDAVTAYHRCVSLEPEHYQAWNNLSAAYIRLGQKPRAQKILEEALKFCFDDVKMWENYLYVCIDNGDFKSAVKAYHRILDVGEGKLILDSECLEIICTEVNKLSKNDIVRLELLKLMARITSKTSINANVWRVYAALKKPQIDDIDAVIGDQKIITEYSSYIKLLERCILANKFQGKDWLENVGNCIDALNDQIALHESKLLFAKLSRDPNIDRVKGQVDFDLETLIKKIIKVHGKLDGCITADSDDEDDNVFNVESKSDLSKILLTASKLIE